MGSRGGARRGFAESARLWAVAVRAYAYPASVVPILLGSVFAFHETGSFLWGRFALALAAGMLYHTACNLINDYYDHAYGVDREDTNGGSGVLVRGEMTPREIILGAGACLAAGTAMGLYLASLCGAALLVIGLAGLLGAIFYTATPYSAKYNALGEPLVFGLMGVGMTLGAYFVQTGRFGWNAVWVSLPQAFLVTAILQANDMRDVADDRRSGIRTLAIMLSAPAARGFLGILLLAPYGLLAALVVLKVLPPPALAALLSLPMALGLIALFRGAAGDRDPRLAFAPHRAAALQLVFGLLMCAGTAIGGGA